MVQVLEPREPDRVSELVDTIRLSGARDSTGVRVEVGGAWGVQAGISPHATLHVVISGQAWVAVPEEAPRALRTGDVLWLPPDVEHSLAACPGLTLAPCNHATATHARRSGRPMHVGHPPTQSRLLTLHYTHDAEVSTPALLALSAPLHLSAQENPGLVAISQLIDAELAQPQVGTTAAVNSLVDLLLVQLIRAVLARRPDDADPAVLDARLDPIARDAVSLMHREPHRDWTTGSLAAEIGVSRASLTRHFTGAMGTTPGSYLTGWRMDLAASRLRDTDEPVGMIARAVGYASPRAFARAFYRSRRQTPSQYRHHSRERKRAASKGVDASTTPDMPADAAVEPTA
ncbi:AraC family transcriptional regulator [Oerskovia flava]|uniref:AraC family transcriptional regulator n=1 Tax=Oerskovia flava TaxID=2986422 RepID=UPI002240862F|nr:AraC family transcriptional regulator [Oerskovia sp. JB1-3-2]